MTFPESDAVAATNCDGLESRLACAEALFARGLETILVPVGSMPEESQLLSARRKPGVSIWPDALTSHDPGRQDAGGLLAEIAEVAEADLILVHDARLIARHRAPLPTIVCCADSSILRWRIEHGAANPPAELIRDAELERAGLLAADAIIVPSRSMGEALRVEHGLPRMPLVAASAFMNRPGRTAAPTILDDLLGARPARALAVGHRSFALMAGRLYDPLTDADILDLAAERIGATLLAAGPIKPDARSHGGVAHTRAMPNFSSLHTIGRLSDPDMNRLLDHAPVFVSAARYRAFGRVLVQAAQHGCALILSDIPVHREFWRGAATFVAPGDAQGFASAIRRGLEDDDHRAAMAEAALRRVRMLARLWKPDALHDAFAAISEGAALTAAE